MNHSRRILPAIFVPILIGSIGIIQMTGRPRFALFHTVDVLQLIASGMCFGVALAALLIFLRKRSDL